MGRSGATPAQPGQADVVHTTVLTGVTRAARTVLSHDLVPQVDAGLPGPGLRRGAPAGRGRAVGHRKLVFFPSCTGSLFGPEGQAVGASTAFLALCERAGLRAVVPEGIDDLCCGNPWESKGFTAGQKVMAARVFDAVWAASEQGARPVVCDASSCSRVALAGRAGARRGAVRGHTSRATGRARWA